MSESTPDSRSSGVPHPRWTWRRAVVTLSSVGIAVAIAIGGLAVVGLNHLEWIARWSIERALPGVTAEFGRVKLNGWDELVVERFALRDVSGGDVLLRLARGRIVFSVGEFFGGNLREIELHEPDLIASQKLFALIPKGAEGAVPVDLRLPQWSVQRLRVHDATVSVPASAAIPANVRARFSMDWKPFGLGGEAGNQILELTVHDVEAAIPEAPSEFIRIGEAHATFSLNEIFGRRFLRSLWVHNASASLAGATWAAVRSYQPTPRVEGGGPFVVGQLQIPEFAVSLGGLGGGTDGVSFLVSANLQNIGDPAADDLLSAEVTDLTIGSATRAVPVMKLDAASVKFRPAGLMRREIDAIVLTNPAITVPDPGKSGGPPRGGRVVSTLQNAAELPGAGWKVGSIRCPYGTLRFEPARPGMPILDTKFAFQINELGTGSGLADLVHRLILWDVQVHGAATDAPPILALDTVGLDFSISGLMTQRRVEGVHISGGSLRVGESLAALVAAGDSGSAGSTSNGGGPLATSSWKVGKLDIQGIRARLDDARDGVSDIFVTINTTLENLPLSLAADELLDEVRLLEFADVEIRSPLDRAILILKLRSVFVRFTIEELLRNELREVVVLRPTIFLNQDLFVYMERATAKPDAAGAAPKRNWKIGTVEAKFGRLVIGGGTGADVGLPLNFETRAQNVAFDNLAELQLQAALEIPKQSYAFPSYQIEIDDVEGDLRFSYPPEKGEKNLVQKLDIGEIRWRQFQAGQSWVAVTFDQRGINGQFGGTAYSGYINGGFSFFFQNDSPWIGWVSGTDVDTASVTRVVSPQNFKMTGPLGFEVQVDAFGKSIDRMIGKFGVNGGGTMRVTKLDELMQNIPDDWSALKQSTTRIGLETLRDFDYTEADGRLWFVQSQGVLNLDLEGPSGTRRFELVLHDGDSSAGLWQIGSSGKKDNE